jgi:glycosyltransferase involved in cell wall biosynthesis
MLSIVIPTLNEEDNIKKLLESIRKQDFDDYEIIVADAGSKDGTKKIAQKFGCKIVKGGTPAKGRNQGAKEAKGNILLFLDADVILKNNSLKKALKEFKKKKLKIATFFLLPSGSKKAPKFLFTFFYNIPIFLMEKILPHAAMGILVNKALFKKLGGFDEKITLAEDHDLARRAKKLGKLGKYGIIKSSNIYVSDRRFRKEGWLKTYSKYLLCEGHMILIGPVKKDLFKYTFEHLQGKKK